MLEMPLIMVIEELEVPADINKSGRKRGSKAKYDQAIQNLDPSSIVKELQPDGMHSGKSYKYLLVCCDQCTLPADYILLFGSCRKRG